MGKIGILGGTFDPIHNGHLWLGEQAYEEYGLDEVWFMPSGHPPHKQDHPVTGGDKRWDMVRLAIADHPHFAYSDFELQRPGYTYTAQTLALLRETYPRHSFYFIIGADSLYQIEGWYHPEQVMARATLLVAGRAYKKEHRSLEQQIAYLNRRYEARILPLHCGEMDVSSADLRRMALEGKDISSFVPAAVADYIRSHGLYQGAGMSIN
ncbi:MAG: nicotinate-nucleotide adenylyltransferase [Enterocloster asparagiformis]|nr:nicotinate-nucleotide adenylyltransferase [Enterocloster asparagiformis]